MQLLERFYLKPVEEVKIDLQAVNDNLKQIKKKIADATAEHNQYLKESGLPLI